MQSAILLASHGGSDPVPLRVLAERLGAPRHFLGKVLISLRRHGLVRSRGGLRGGYLLARPAAGIALLDIVRAVEPHFRTDGCILGYGETSPMCPCPLCRAWAGSRREIDEDLLALTLEHLATGLPQSLRVGWRTGNRRPGKAQNGPQAPFPGRIGQA